MARQRRSSSTIKLLSFTNSSSSCSSHVPPPTRVIDPKRLRFLFQKELKNSDVSSLRRMILPKRAAEAHLPVLESKEGILISMDDLDGLHVWSFKYRQVLLCSLSSLSCKKTFITLNSSYKGYNGISVGYVCFGLTTAAACMCLKILGNSLAHMDYNWGISSCCIKTVKIKTMYDLPIIWFLELLKNLSLNSVKKNVFQVIQAKKASDEDVYSDIARNGVNDLFLHDYEVGKSSCYYYPTMDDSGLSFIYDNTLTFSNDCPLDFLDGSMTNYSRMGPLESFGSVENLSLDEFYQL
ncbi:B3 domain-containing transcription factor FUS3 [Hibiscus syriacus]|uniref:B3 domain-containing transcription factor FUS3 n=1 Tax=Hibiscus syriacus TaxID=106335 RepID=A0A6A3AUW0_HIBSY|nr:B3 domain-containing transcription factor FUS3 [Hibiscus syriacus]